MPTQRRFSARNNDTRVTRLQLQGRYDLRRQRRIGPSRGKDCLRFRSMMQHANPSSLAPWSEPVEAAYGWRAHLTPKLWGQHIVRFSLGSEAGFLQLGRRPSRAFTIYSGKLFTLFDSIIPGCSAWCHLCLLRPSQSSCAENPFGSPGRRHQWGRLPNPCLAPLAHRKPCQYNRAIKLERLVIDTNLFNPTSSNG